MPSENHYLPFQGKDLNQAFIEALKTFPIENTHISTAKLVFESLNTGGFPKFDPSDELAVKEYIEMCRKYSVDPFSTRMITYDRLPGAKQSYSLAAALYYDSTLRHIGSPALLNQIAAIRLGAHRPHMTVAVLNHPGYRRFMREPLERVSRIAPLYHASIRVSPHRNQDGDPEQTAIVQLIDRTVSEDHRQGITLHFPNRFNQRAKGCLLEWMLNSAPPTREEMRQSPFNQPKISINSSAPTVITGRFGVQ